MVQSQYNVTLENTSLYFDVCNNAGGCERSRLTTISKTANTTVPIESVEELNHTIVIVIATLASGVGVSLILVGVLCWKRKRNQKAEKQKSN